MARISKQRVKAYFDHDGEELGKTIKEKMDNKDNWGDFKGDLAAAISNYANHPTAETKQALNDLMDRNFTGNEAWSRETLEKILEDLGIKDLSLISDGKATVSEREANSISYRRAVFEQLGIEFPEDTIERYKRKWQEREDKKYGIVRKGRKPAQEQEEQDSKRTKKEEKEAKPKKEDGKIIKAIKQKYFRLTADIIMAPGEVPPEILAENRELLKKASNQVKDLDAEIKRARDIIANQNKSSLDLSSTTPEVVEIYNKMVAEELDEETLDGFAVTLQEEEQKQIEKVRDGFGQFETMKKAQLEETLKSLIEANFSDIEGQELLDEIEYAVLDSEIDKDGNLVLPPRSVFSELFTAKEGETISPDAEKAKQLLSTYRATPRIEDLSSEEIIKLGRNFKNLDKMDPSSKEYAVAKYISEHPEMMPADVDTVVAGIEGASKAQIATERMAQEAELRHKSLILDEIQGQFQNISQIVEKYDVAERAEPLSKDDKKKRAIALKIARAKVASLEKTKLTRVIEDGATKTKGLLKRARSVLLPSLEEVRDNGKKKLEEQYVTPEEEQEQGE